MPNDREPGAGADRHRGEVERDHRAVPKLLKLLSLEGCTVTVDALNCQRTIAQPDATK